MAKQKANLADMSFDLDTSPNVGAAVLTDADLPGKTVGVYIKVEDAARQQMREWCVRHKMTMRDILEAGFAALVEKHGP